jgi:hypothetical protein
VDEAETTPEIAWRGPVSEARERVPEMRELVVVAFVVVELPLMVRFPTVEEAVRIMPRVVVGARYPSPCTDQSPNCDLK